jgi:alpha-glucosidase (family GH31 glycosyl hydrolase)
MSGKAKTIGLVALAIFCCPWRAATPMSGDDRTSGTPERIGRFAGYRLQDRSLLVNSTTGAKMRLTPYGDHMIRVQIARKGQPFVPDDALLMVERHDLGGYLVVVDEPGQLTISTGKADGVSLTLAKGNLTARWRLNGAAGPQLVEQSGVQWDGSAVSIDFVPDIDEHFAGLGHGFFGRDAAPLDLRGRAISRSYGSQASLVAPWFLSSKGYGFFLNCLYPHRFRFNKEGHFDVQVTGTDLGAQLDYFVVAGATPLELIDRYTQLTGRPRLQRKGMYGLQVSDKPHEAESLKTGMSWWFDHLPKLRAAGIPVDAIIMDNTWRAGGGTWHDSIFAFDPVHYPDPKAFYQWAQQLGLMVDVDFNGTMYMQSAGWKPEFGIHGGTWNPGVPFYLLNFFNPAADDWLWQLMWGNVLNPRLGYPNDMVWMDETDEATVDDERAPFSGGRPWLELKNQYVLTGAKALVAHWDESFAGSKRPYIWFRSATSGLQRYCTYWTGDTEGNESDQAAQVTAMLAAGIAGMPYFNHDAGGFQSIDEDIYRRYAIVEGSLSPVWRLHGIRGPRWPTEYGADVQALARRYAELRYHLMPYLYTLSREATVTGAPMMRAMFLQYPAEQEAWRRDYQYLIGPSLLVAPPVRSRTSIWLPPGQWFDWWTGAKLSGGQSIAPPTGDDAALYVRAGAVIPIGPFALSTALVPADQLQVHVWVGASGSFELYEDDGVTEAYSHGAFALTSLAWDDASQTLSIAPSEGAWAGAPSSRTWTVVIHGLQAPTTAFIDGQPIPGGQFDQVSHTMSLQLPPRPAGAKVTLNLAASH